MCCDGSAEERGHQEESGGSGQRNEKESCAQYLQYGDECQFVSVETHCAELGNDFRYMRQLGGGTPKQHNSAEVYQDPAHGLLFHTRQLLSFRSVSSSIAPSELAGITDQLFALMRQS